MTIQFFFPVSVCACVCLCVTKNHLPQSVGKCVVNLHCCNVSLLTANEKKKGGGEGRRLQCVCVRVCEAGVLYICALAQHASQRHSASQQKSGFLLTWKLPSLSPLNPPTSSPLIPPLSMTPSCSSAAGPLRKCCGGCVGVCLSWTTSCIP